VTIELLNAEQYIIQRVQESVSDDIDTSQGSGFRDLLISPLVPILTPLMQEIYRIRQSQSIANAEQLTDADVDAILANVFVARKKGEKAQGVVRSILRDAINTTIDSGTVFYTTGGLRFYSTAKVAVTSAQILAGGEEYYFVDVNVIAASEGTEYNIDPREIAGVITTNSNIVGARNENAFFNGKATEDSLALIQRAQDGITQRDLNTEKGILYILDDQFDQIDRVDVVGFADAAMTRDKITGRNLVFSGISIPDTTGGAHCGAMADVYVKVGHTELNANIQNPQVSGQDPYNTIALYEEADEIGTTDDTIYEDTDCYNIEKPVVSMEEVIRIDTVGTQLQSLVEGTDYVVYVSNAAMSMSMQDRRSIKFCRGSGIIQSVVKPSLTPLSNMNGVPAIVRMDDYLSTDSIKNEGYADHMRVTVGEDLIDFTESYSGAGSLKFTGDSSSYAFFDDSSDSSLGAVMEGASEFTFFTWVRPSMAFSGESDVYGTYQSNGLVYNIYQQTLFALGDHGSNEETVDDEHLFAAHLHYDEGTGEGKLKVVIGTENVILPTSTLSSTFFTPNDAYKWLFVAVTYKSSESQDFGTLKAYVQWEDGSFGNGNGLPQQILHMTSPFVSSGLLKTGWSDRFGYVGRSNVDAIKPPADPDQATPTFPFHGHIDEIMIDQKEYKEAQVASIFKGMSSAKLTVTNQSIYNEDGALNAAFGGEPPGEKPFNGLWIQLITGVSKGGIYEVIDSTYDSSTEYIGLTLRTDSSQPDIGGIVVGDSIIVAPVYTGKDGQLTSVKPGLVYADRIEYDDDTVYTFTTSLNKGDWAPIGTSIRIRYKTSADIEQIQTFADSKLNRTVVSDNLVKFMNPVLVDFDAFFTPTDDDSTTDNIPRGGALEISDIVDHMYSLSCKYVQMPLSVSIEVRDADGRLYTEVASDRYALDGSQVFLANDITLTEI